MSTDEGLLPPSARPGAGPTPAPHPARATRTPPDGRRRTSRRLPRRRTTRSGPRPGPTAATDRAPTPAVAGSGVRFWQRDHPVFVPLTGFFTGVVAVLVVLGLLGWLLEDAFGVDVAARPWVFVVGLGGLLVVNVALLVVRRSRRFARYMLLGVLVTPAVVAATAALTTLLLIGQDA